MQNLQLLANCSCSFCWARRLDSNHLNEVDDTTDVLSGLMPVDVDVWGDLHLLRIAGLSAVRLEPRRQRKVFSID
jgi:hypothetical protein